MVIVFGVFSTLTKRFRKMFEIIYVVHFKGFLFSFYFILLTKGPIGFEIL